jgi:hypothetical protein
LVRRNSPLAQVKFEVEDELLEKFRQIVIRKHGKLELAIEGEEAIRLYVRKYESLIKNPKGKRSLARAIGMIESGVPRNALEDLKKLESDP